MIENKSTIVIISLFFPATSLCLDYVNICISWEPQGVLSCSKCNRKSDDLSTRLSYAKWNQVTVAKDYLKTEELPATERATYFYSLCVHLVSRVKNFDIKGYGYLSL